MKKQAPIYLLLSAGLILTPIASTMTQTSLLQSVYAQDQAVDFEVYLQVGEEAHAQSQVTYQILRESDKEVVYDSTQNMTFPTLSAGKYIYRLFDDQNFQREGQAVEVDKVIRKQSGQEESLDQKGEIKNLANSDNKVYEFEFDIEEASDSIHYEIYLKSQAAAAEEAENDEATASSSEADDQAAVESEEAAEEPSSTEADSEVDSVDSTASAHLIIQAQDQAGQALAHLKLMIGNQEVETDESGMASIADLEAGTYSVGLSDESRQTYQIELAEESPKTVDLVAGQVQDLVLTFNPIQESTESSESSETTETTEVSSTTMESSEAVEDSSQEISSETSQAPLQMGQVRFEVKDQSGNPVAGLELLLGEQSQVTDEQGQAVFEDLVPQDYSLSLGKKPEGYVDATLDSDSPKNIQIEAGDQKTVSLTLAAATLTGNLSLEVRDQNQEPVAGVEIQVTPSQMRSQGQSVKTDDKGQANLQGLGVGKYTYQIVSVPQGFQADDETYEIDLQANQSNPQVLSVTRLEQKASLRLTVLDSSGKPVKGQKVQLGQSTLITDQAGQVTWSDLSAGDYQFQLPDLASVYRLEDSTKFQLEAGEDKELTIHLKAAQAQLTLKVTDADSKPLEGSAIYLRDEGKNYEKVLKTNAKGQVDFTALSPGHYFYQMTQAPKGYRIIKEVQEVTLKDQDAVEQLLSLEKESKQKPIESGKTTTSTTTTTTTTTAHPDKKVLTDPQTGAQMTLRGSIAGQAHSLTVRQVKLADSQLPANLKGKDYHIYEVKVYKKDGSLLSQVPANELVIPLKVIDSSVKAYKLQGQALQELPLTIQNNTVTLSNQGDGYVALLFQSKSANNKVTVTKTKGQKTGNLGLPSTGERSPWVTLLLGLVLLAAGGYFIKRKK